MSYTTLISPTELVSHLNDPEWVILDCRFSLADTEQGRRDYFQAHIPRAIYVHLDEDLSGPIIAGKTSRHPLPEIEAFARQLSRWGIDEEVQVIAYDDRGGAIAARLWWMLKWLGHEAVAVLDGGWTRWQAEARPISGDHETRPARTFTPRPQTRLLSQVDEVMALSQDPRGNLFDARTPERYRGETEPIDPVAGHIPGAISAPYADNLGTDGAFLPARQLRSRFETLLGEGDPNEAIFYCGSGVTAAHNLLALAHSGLGLGRLYAGSWSEWITDPARPVATGSS